MLDIDFPTDGKLVICVDVDDDPDAVVLHVSSDVETVERSAQHSAEGEETVERTVYERIATQVEDPFASCLPEWWCLPVVLGCNVPDSATVQQPASESRAVGGRIEAPLPSAAGPVAPPGMARRRGGICLPRSGRDRRL
ncbi:hypothetical protein [Streptomyces hirsutus]|uniref:hypothetical protein n=1 Tax=Streptomyces hirsutus TaxID=35620 RepID=UPI001147A198|nr:hypothetical protein [Streptomyces hirsutus]